MRHCDVLWEKGPACRSWKATCSHFLKIGSKYTIFIDSDRKKCELFYDIHRCFDNTFRFCTKVRCLRIKICWNIQFHVVKKITKILESCFPKTTFFYILFLKSHIPLSFWVRELGEVSFDSKLLTDYHAGCNSISATWSLFLKNIM